jgi:hypothetical protein
MTLDGLVDDWIRECRDDARSEMLFFRAQNPSRVPITDSSK